MATKVEVSAGDCGFSAVIEVVRLDDQHVQVTVHSECEQITGMNPDLARLQWKGKGHTVFKRMTESAVYQSAARHIRHTACPVPAAILKAIEVEVGVALPKEVTLTFDTQSPAPVPVENRPDQRRAGVKQAE